MGRFLLLVWTLQGTTSDEALRLAREELRSALGERADDAVAQRVDEVEWPSSALGCPEEGMVYTQAVVPGFSILFAIDGEVHRVHVGGGRAIVCGRAFRSIGAVQRLEPAIADPEDPALKRKVEDAREDLADRLSVEPDEIDLLEVESVVWPDRGLGCPKPGVEYPQVPVDGVRIRLRVGETIYHYHGGGNRDPFYCDKPSQ